MLNICVAIPRYSTYAVLKKFLMVDDEVNNFVVTRCFGFLRAKLYGNQVKHYYYAGY